MAIDDKQYSSWLKKYYARSESLTKLSMRLPIVIAAASGFPLYTKFGTSSSRRYLTLGLLLSGGAVLLEYLRLHVNLRHIDRILLDSDKYDDFYYDNTCWGKIGEYLYWIRGVLMLVSGLFLVFGIYRFHDLASLQAG